MARGEGEQRAGPRGGRHQARRQENTLRRSTVVAVLVTFAALAAGIVAFLILFETRVVVPVAAGAADAEDCAAEPLDVAVAPELVEVLTELAATYAQRSGVEPCAPVAIRGSVPAEAADLLSQGADPSGAAVPDVWIPDSSVWVRAVAAVPEAAELLPDERPSIARSPTVIAMPKPMAEALGWPARRLGWADLLALAGSDGTWAANGHPEWEPFRLELADPPNSSAGLHAVLSLGAAQSGVYVDALSAEALRDPAVRVPLIGLERRNAERAPSVDDQLAALRRADDAGTVLAAVSAFAVTERDVWRYNLGLDRGSPPQVPLAAVYPPEGGLPFDYPYVALRAAAGAEAEGPAGVAAGFAEFLLTPGAQERLQAEGFRNYHGDPGESLQGVDGVAPERAGADLPAPDAEAVRTALETWQAISRRGNTLAVIDVSGSMADEAPGTGRTLLQFTVDTAVQGAQLFAPDSEVGLWEFSTGLRGGASGGDYRELVSIGPVGEEFPGGGTRRDALTAALQGLRPANDTALYDTLLAAFDTVRAAYDGDELNTVVLFTDGRSDGDDLSLDGLLEQLGAQQDPARPVQLVAIAYGADPPVDELNAIVGVVGGTVFTPSSPDQIEQVFLQVLTGG